MEQKKTTAITMPLLVQGELAILEIRNQKKRGLAVMVQVNSKGETVVETMNFA